MYFNIYSDFILEDFIFYNYDDGRIDNFVDKIYKENNLFKG